MTVGERIKFVRESLNMSQEELAKKMGYKDRSSISKIEKSKDDDIYLDTIQRIAEILNCSPLYLMGWDNKDDNKNRTKEQHFVELYNQLNDSEKIVVDKLLESLTSGK